MYTVISGITSKPFSSVGIAKTLNLKKNDDLGEEEEGRVVDCFIVLVVLISNKIYKHLLETTFYWLDEKLNFSEYLVG